MATAVIQFASALGSIIGVSHAKAVAAEANSLNVAVPNYRQNLVAIVQAINAGTADVNTGLAAVDESVAAYYSSVAGIIKDNSNHGANCTDLDAQGKGTNCNGPCTVGCAWIVPWANRVKAAIQAGSGTLSFSAIPGNAGFSGLPAWGITVNRPALALSVGPIAVGPTNIGSGAPPVISTPANSSPLASILSPSAPSFSVAPAPSTYAPLQASFVPSLPYAAPAKQNSTLLLGAGALAVALLFAFAASGRK